MPYPTDLLEAAEIPAELRERLAREALASMVSRLTTGTPAYPIVALLFLGASHQLSSRPSWALTLVALVAVATATRLGVLLRGAEAWRRCERRGRYLTGAAVAAPLVVFSAVGAYALMTEGPTVLTALLLLCASVFPTSATFALGPSRSLNVGFNTATLVPLIAAGAITGGPEGWLLAGLIALLYAYLLSAGGVYHRQYWRSALDRALLEVGEKQSRLLAAAVDHADQVIVLTDRRGGIQYVNPTFERITGYSRAEACGRLPVEIGRPVRDGALEELFESIAEGRPWVGEERLRVRDDSVIDFATSVSPVRDEAGAISHWVWMGRDVTEERRLQRRLAVSDRLSSLGSLAAGVAHEINNPLSYVSLNVEELRQRLAVDPEGSALLEEIDEGTERVRRTVHQLLAFARDPAGEQGSRTRRTVDLDDVVAVARRLAHNEIRHRARLEIDHRATRRAVGSEPELVQVLVNLLVNAAQAIDEHPGGTGLIRVVTRDVDDQVEIEVHDTGPGIPEDLRERIFDPFFTTKPGSRGTGIGLAHCHRVVSSVGGHIQALDGEDGGAVFRVRLPAGEPVRDAEAVEPGPTAPRPRPQTADFQERREARVLVVDDEPLIGRSIRRALRHHEVAVTQSGEEAVALWGEERFDLMLCDVMMPGLAGPDVYEAVAARGDGSESRIVFMTGGAFTPSTQRFLRSVPNERLDKPLETAALRELVASRAGAADRANGCTEATADESEAVA